MNGHKQLSAPIHNRAAAIGNQCVWKNTQPFWITWLQNHVLIDSLPQCLHWHTWITEFPLNGLTCVKKGSILKLWNALEFTGVVSCLGASSSSRHTGSSFWHVISFKEVSCLSFLMMLLGGNWCRWWNRSRRIIVTIRTALFPNPSSITNYSTVEVAYEKEINSF